MIAQVQQEAEFLDKLSAVARMFKLQLALVWSLRGLAAGLAIDSVILLVSRFQAFTPPSYLLIAIAAGFVLIGLVIALSDRFRPESVALRVDQHLGLKERVTTALELQKARVTGLLANAQLTD